MDRQLDYLIEVSIHAPRVGSDSNIRPRLLRVSVFQSTLPAWGATVRAHLLDERQHCFNPRSPRGERRVQRFDYERDTKVSIHAPRVGSDPFTEPITTSSLCFNPRSPRGERRLVHRCL